MSATTTTTKKRSIYQKRREKEMYKSGFVNVKKVKEFMIMDTVFLLWEIKNKKSRKC